MILSCLKGSIVFSGSLVRGLRVLHILSVTLLLVNDTQSELACRAEALSIALDKTGIVCPS